MHRPLDAAPAATVPIGRRAFAAGLGALALPGCSAKAVRPGTASAQAACLRPVNVSPDRVIRTVAGLRPYRRSGFVVRREALGDTALVHNYGHGGSGITLSWGTSRLAADLGLPGHQGPVAVLGCGIVGLTTARLVQEAGFPVTLYARELPPETTSNIAGGQFGPSSLFDPEFVDEAWRAQFLAALHYGWRRFQIMVGDDYGIHWTPTYEHSDGTAPNAAMRPFHPNGRVLGPGEHPFPNTHVFAYDTMYAETGRLLRQLMRDVQTAGGRIEVRDFASREQVMALPEKLVFNCTGLGAHALFGDEELMPIRGQLAILLPQSEVNYAYLSGSLYMFPRADGIVLGGTFERGQWDATPQPDAIARILDRHAAVFGTMPCPA